MPDVRLISGSTPAVWAVLASGTSQPLGAQALTTLLDKCAKLALFIDQIGAKGLKADYDHLYRFDAIVLNGSQQGAAARLSFAAPLEIPGLLIARSDAALMRAEDFKADAQIIGEAAKARAQEALTLLKDCVDSAKAEIRRLFANVSLTYGAEGFFGATGVGGIAGAARLSLAINPAALFPGAQEAAQSDELLRAELAADVVIVKGAGTAAGVISLAVVVTAHNSNPGASPFQLTPALALPDIPGGPRLRLNFPQVPLPGLRLDGLNFPDVQPEFIDVGARLTSIGGAPALKLKWTNQPTLAVELSGGAVALKFGPGNGQLLSDGNEIATLTGVAVSLTNDRYALKGDIEGHLAQPLERQLADLPNFDLGGRLPVYLDITGATASLTLDGKLHLDDQSVQAGFAANMIVDFQRIVVRDKDDPRLSLAFAATLDTSTGSNGGPAGRLTSIRVLDPAPMDLVTAAGQAAISGVLRLIGVIDQSADVDKLRLLIDRVDSLIVSSLRRAAAQAGVLAGLAADAVEALTAVFKLLSGAADQLLASVIVDVRLDADTYRLRQILVTPLDPDTLNAPPKLIVKGALEVQVPSGCQPSLLIDVSGPLLAALIVDPSKDAPLVVSTDLWLARDGAAPEAARDVDHNGQPPTERLIKVTAHQSATGPSLAAIALDDRALAFLRGVKIAGAGLDAISVAFQKGVQNMHVRLIRERPQIVSLQLGDLEGELSINADAANRILPLLDQPAPGVHLPDFAPTVRVTGVEPAGGTIKLNGSGATMMLGLEIGIGNDLKSESKLQLTLDIATFSMRLAGLDAVIIRGTPKTGTLFGLDYALTSKKAGEAEFNQFELDLGGGSPKFALHSDADFKLFYKKLAANGRGLVFTVSQFAVAKGGVNLTAKVDPTEPVTLPGVGVPFRFRDGELSIRNGEIQGFSLTGAGQLPPDLVGDANCTISLTLGRDGDGGLAVLACDAELDKANDPIVCHATRFTLTISKLGFAVHDFGAQGGYQFYFLITGTLVFTPPGGEFGDTFLKYLRGLKITLTKAPLAGDVRLLARAIDIQIALDPKVSFNLFEIFAFELRGVGFHPSSPAFGGDPALSLSGQARFLEAGDVVSSKIDFHDMQIARPAKGQSLPRVHFDGLTVSLSLHGMGSIEGTAITVDDTLPTLYKPDTLKPGVTARGFLASGRLALSGWGPMTASMGFLELKQAEQTRHAFFLYGQMDALSIEIPTPIKEIYLRSVGFGFGYRYTLAGLRRADTVTNPRELIQVLDDVSKYQNDLAKFEAWEPEADGDRITLAMAAVLSVNSASKNFELSEKEKDLPNPVLLDVSAALRSDLTFLMTARAWLSVNYYDYLKGPDKEMIHAKPPLRGYLYISAPRKELLARLVSDPGGYFGDKPPLADELKRAFRDVKWSSTLYIRPGLFHFEFGWPYELEVKLGKPDGDFALTLNGGLIFRIEDVSLLYGLAFRAAGFAKIGGQIGGSSLGASVEARADFHLDGKFIAYIPLDRPAEALFYGAIAFSCTILFRVRVWLEIDLAFDTLHLEAGFSQSLSLSLALEVALGPKTLGARGVATISVGAFGRTLSLSVGFSVNDGQLNVARARVERFLSLGLTAAVPDPATGLIPPAPPPAKPADEKHFNDAAKDSGTLAETHKPEPPPAPGGALQIELGSATPAAPRFFALLFELKARPGIYVLQLVPRDATEAGVAIETDHPVELTDETFYAPPEDGYDYMLDVAPNLDWRSLIGGAPAPLNGGDVLKPALSALVATSGSSTLELRDLLEGAYPRKTVDYDPANKRASVRDRENPPPFVHLENEAIAAARISPATAEAAQAALADAAAAAAKLSIRRSLLRAVEERRSSIIAAVAASAERLATGARFKDGGTSLDEIEWPPRLLADASGVIDARDFGLTFVVQADERDHDTLSGLFQRVPGGPPVSNFKLKLRKGGADVGEARQVLLFNPPSMFFDSANPDLAGLNPVIDRRGVAFDWDLTTGWGQSDGVWSDPEFHLKHYRIARVFLHNGGLLSGLKPFETTTKAAAPLHPTVKDTQVVWKRVRPLTQFIDDFSDLPVELRPALLGRALDGADDKAVEKSRRAWSDRFTIPPDEKIEIEYTIVPVDIAGREGAGSGVRVLIPELNLPKPGIARAELIVAYETLPRSQRDKSEPPPSLSLRLDDLLARAADADDTAQAERLPEQDSVYELRVRPEPPAPIGLFGADAVTAALAKPTPEAFEPEHPDDETFDLTLHYPANAGHLDADHLSAYRRDNAFAAVPIVSAGAKPPPDAPYFTCTPDFATLIEALGHVGDGSGTKPNPVRVAVRGKTPPSDTSPRARWLVAETYLRIGDPTPDRLGRWRPRPIDTIVETLELPVAAGFAPLRFEDLYGEAGRLLIDYPQPDADFSVFVGQLKDNGAQAQRLRLRDGDRRVATRLRWNSRPTLSPPTAAPGVVNASPELIAGFDVFEIDLTGTLTHQDMLDTSREIARVMTLDPRLANAEPASIEDYGAVEAFYQSEALRLSKASGPARRAAWYSPSESLCVWPEFSIRRSAGLAINDADFAPLFKLGLPDRIEIAFDGAPRIDPSEKPDETKTWSRLRAYLAQLKMPQPARMIALTSDVPGFQTANATLADGVAYAGDFDASALRRLLFGLTTAGQPGDWWNDTDPGSSLFQSREALRGLDLTVIAWRGTRRLGEATFRVDLDTFLHPVLADALDAMRWEMDENEKPLYRRYQPVVDPAPHTDAKSVAEFLDQRPLGRDPYGWAVLRTLGLAIGVRLLDQLSGDFLDPTTALPLIHNAFALALRRYPGLALGAPTVETLARADGIYTLASFDGGAPQPAKDDSFANELTSLTQLSLRPIAEDFASAPPACLYYCVRASGMATTISLNAKTPPGGRAGPLLIDLVDLASGLSAGLVNAIAANDDAIAVKRLAAGRRTQETLTLELAPDARPRDVAILRIMTTLPSQEVEMLLHRIVTANAGELSFDDLATPRLLAKDAPMDSPEAFERFPELPATAIATLVGGQTPQTAAADHFAQFKLYADARFPGAPISVAKDDEADAFFARWPGLVRRFLNHGPAQPPVVARAKGAEYPDEVKASIAYAFALIPRPQPFRVSIENDATMQILLVHQDRLAHRRRYLVRPFSRYDNLMAAWDAGRTVDAQGYAQEIRLPWMQGRRLADSFAPVYAGKAVTLPLVALAEIDRYSVDIVAPRTEPLQPPVVLSARRLDPGQGTSQRPGRLIEFTFARHQDEVASEFNATVADSLQFEHMAFGFWRDFAHPQWAMALKTVAQTSDPHFDFALLPAALETRLDPAPLSFARSDSFEELENGLPRASLPERISEGWRGVTALRTQGVPHFQRIHVAAYAAAGVVVSTPVVATVPEGRYELKLPDAAPIWTVTLENNLLRVAALLPLTRFVDGMSKDERDLWCPADAVERRVFDLPDPGVAYEFSTRYKPDDGGVGDSVAEAAYAVRNEAEATFAVVSTSNRFKIATVPTAPEWPDDGKPWRLTQTLTGRSPPPPPPDWPTLLGQTLHFAGNFDLAPENWTAFAPFAPKSAAKLVLNGPYADDAAGTPDWNALGAAAAGYRLRLAAYAAGAAPVEDWPKLDTLLANVAALAQDAVGQRRSRWNKIAADYNLDNTRPLSIPIVARAGVARDGGTPGLVKVDTVEPDAWALDAPADVRFVLRAPAMAALRHATPRPQKGAADVAAFADRLASALWGLDRGAAVAADATPTNGFAPLARAFPASLDAAAAAKTAPVSPGLEFVARFDILAPKDSLWPPAASFAPFAALLNDLTQRQLYAGQAGLGFAAALEALRPLELQGGGAATLFVPFASTEAVAALLATIPDMKYTSSPRPVALLLRRPPTDAELRQIADPAVATFAYGLAADQIYGLGRRAFWKANKGFLDAVSALIQREGEARI